MLQVFSGPESRVCWIIGMAAEKGKPKACTLRRRAVIRVQEWLPVGPVDSGWEAVHVVDR
jgi:hypothetical protein